MSFMDVQLTSANGMRSRATLAHCQMGQLALSIHVTLHLLTLTTRNLGMGLQKTG